MGATEPAANDLGEKLELAPVALIAVFAVAGAIKLTWSVVPQGAMATVKQLIWATDEDEPSTAPSAASSPAEDVNAPSPSVQVGTRSAAPH